MRIGMMVLGAVLLFAPASPLGSSGRSLSGQAMAAPSEQNGTLRDAVQQAQHQAQREGARVRLPNPENGLEADFQDGSMTVAHGGGRFGLRLEAYGFGDHPAPVAPGSIYTRGTRVEYRRGLLTEWYVSDSRGLEQGFTLAMRPSGVDGGPLHLDLAVSGTVTPVLSGDHIELQRDGRTVLAYSGLRAWDSIGRVLDARMVATSGRISLLVDDRNAVYPLTVDPWIQQQELTASDGVPNDRFGDAVAISGDTAVVGASVKHGAPGSAYIFVRGAGGWTLQQELTASDGFATDQFGSSVSLDGDTAVIGANSKGAAYVFVRSGGVWSQQAELLDPIRNDSSVRWGDITAVSVNGDTAVLGERHGFLFNYNPNAGAALVYVRSGSTWTLQQTLTSSDTQYGDGFGNSVSVSGETVVVGAPNFTINPNTPGQHMLGAAYVFVRNGGVWSQQTELWGNSDLASFGTSVAASGDSILIGSTGDKLAFVFHRSGVAWSQQAALYVGATYQGFGAAVSLSGDTAVVGANAKNSSQGSAYVFVRTAGIWSQQGELSASDGAANDRFGDAVAVSGGAVIVGADYRNGSQGAAYEFEYAKLGTNAVLVGSSAGTSSVVLSYRGAWTATANDPFLHISAGSGSGTGSALVVFSYDAFAGTGTRTGTLTIAGGTVTVTQAGINYAGPATATTVLASGLTIPYGLAVDAAGNLYIVDPGAATLKKWDPSTQQVTTLLSTGLVSPYGVAVSNSGDVFISDTGTSTVKKWSASTQQVTTLVSSGLNAPFGVAVDDASNVFIADTMTNAIKKWSADTQQVTTLISSGLNLPRRVVVDGAGNLYIADSGSNSVKKWTAATQQLTTLASSGLSGPFGLAVDGSGNVFIADQGNNSIKEWSISAQQLSSIATGLNSPGGVAVDGAGNVFIADSGNGVVKVVPYVFVGPASLSESSLAGSDSLLPVLPATASLTGIFAPTSDQSWLTIGAITNGVINFSFTENASLTRVAHIAVLGQQITVTQNGLLGQTITFGALPNLPISSTPFTVSATSSSGLSVGFNSLTTSVCTVTGVTVTLVAAGACTIQATQSGNTSFAPATPVVQTFQVTLLPQSITFGALSNRATGAAPFAVSATATSGLAVGFASTTTAVCTVAGATVTMIAAGTCTIQATQLGNATYAAATPVNQSFQVTPVPYLITSLPGGLPSATAALGTSIPLGNVNGVVADPFGNVYLSSNLGCVFKLDANGVLTRIAGNCTFGYSGDGGPAVNAQFYYPRFMALDSAGNLYIADLGNSVIRKVTPAGTISTVAGNNTCGFAGDGGAATSAQLCSPYGVALDSAGNLYIADTSNNTIRKVSANGTISTVAGNGSCAYSGDGGPATSAGLCYPSGVAVDAAGNLYIADASNNAIRKVNSNGAISTVAGNGTCGYSGDGGAASSALLCYPTDIIFDPSGRLYFTDNAAAVRSIAANGIISTVAGNGNTVGFSGDGGPATSALLSDPEGISFDSAGNLYIADTNNKRVRKMNPAGTITSLAGNGVCAVPGDGGPATLPQFCNVSGVTSDAAGSVYVTDSRIGLLRKLTLSGVHSIVAGTGVSGYSGDGGAATSAQITPSAIALDAAGNAFITGGARIRKIATNGIITTVAGTGTSGYSGDNGPATGAKITSGGTGIVVDSAGNVYFTDGNRVRKVTAAGIISTVAGTGTAGYTGDGGPGTSAQLDTPWALAVDSAGNLYVADSNNQRIRMLATNGVISTVAGNGVAGNAGDGGPATSAQLDYPVGIGVDAGNNLYIGTTDNFVRKVSAGGIISTIAGTGAFGTSGDGGPALSAQLTAPVALSVDSSGKIYTWDRRNSPARMLLPAGTAPVLTISQTHSGNFAIGQAGAAYSVTVKNAALALPTAGTVAITETIPSGLTLVSLAGTGWTCTANACTRSDALAAGSSYPPVTVTVNVAANALAQVMPVVALTGGGSIGAAAADLTFIGATTAVLAINSSHAGSFSQGQIHATYTLTVGNQTAAASTSGTITVTETLPAGLTPVSMAGTGWTCATSTCTRSDVLPGGSVFPPIVVTVNVGATAASPQVNSVSVSGGGSPTANATDSTTIVAVPMLSIAKTHTGNFTQGQNNAAYTVTVSNAAGAAPTSGTVTVTETVPTGLTLVSMAGSGWTCPAAGTTCTRSDVLAAGASYPAIAVTVNVAANASAQVTNQVSVSGGGVLVPVTASDPAVIGAGARSYLISTIAGGLLPATSAAATSSAIGSPASVAVDTAGNSYFASPSWSAVFRLDPSGVLTRLAGTGVAGFSGDSGPALSAQLNNPHGVAVDASGNLYIADTNNNRIRMISPSGSITTVAGNGNCCYSGDGVQATTTTLGAPWGVAVDGAGNLYIADTVNQRIRKVNASGTISTVAGSGTAGYSGDNGLASAAQLNSPRGVAVDSSGNLYVADTNNHRIRAVSASGVITTAGGTGVGGFSGDNGPASTAQFNNPGHVVADAAGNLYVADTNNNRVRMIATNGTVSSLAGAGGNGYLGDGGAASSASLYSPYGVAVDAAGALYIADFVNQRIRKVSAGIISTIAGGGTGDAGPAPFAGLSTLFGTATDSAGNLYIADGTANRVRMITPAGVISTVAGSGVTGSSGDGGVATSARLNFPHGLALDSAGNLYIADLNNHRIRKVSTNGTITTIAGTGSAGYSGDNGAATSAQLNNPHGVTVDASGNVFIADTNNNRIRKISTNGTITTVAGTGVAGYSGDNGAATSALLTLPQGAVTDPLGNLYIADTGNNCIRELAANGIITTVAGNGTAGYSGDGGLAAGAKLNSPWGIARDASGNLFFSEVGNSRVREVTAAGLIFTLAGTGSSGYTGNGGPALNATFQGPFGVALDSAGNIYVGDQNNNAVRILTPVAGPALLTVSSSHAGSFAPGGAGQYTITVANAALAGATSGTVTVSETIPPSFTLVSMSGTGWTCAAGACTRADVLPGGSSYPAITVTVNIAAPAPLQATNQVTVSGGGSVLAGAVDLTVISGTAPAAPVLVSPSNLAYGASLSSGLSWSSAAGAASYDVYFGTTTPPVFVANTSGTSYSPAGLIAGTRYYWQIVAKGSAHTASSPLWSFTTTASGSCTYTLSLSATGIAAAGGTGSLTVTAAAGCGWTAVSNQSWLVVTAGAAGTGNGTISYSASVNTGGLRLATLTIGGQTFTLSQAGSYTISTLAGGMLPATAVAATAASIGSPYGIAVDSGGNAYFSSYNLNAVFRIDPSGALTRIAGTGVTGFGGDGGPAVSAQLNNPIAVALDASGNLYIADSSNNRVRLVTPSGTITTVAGNGCCYGGDGGPATSAQLNNPTGVALDSAGDLYIADNNNHRIRKVSAGTISTVAGTGTAGYSGDGAAGINAQLNKPNGVAVDALGNLYIADSTNQRIRRLSVSGTITTLAGTGTAGYSGDSGPATSAQLNFPQRVAVDASGNVFIADTSGNRIRVVSTNGIITTVAGNGVAGYTGDGVAATSSGLFTPNAVAVDGFANLYIADTNNQRIRRVSGGVISTIAGGVAGDGAAARLAGLSLGYGTVRDNSGNIYVSETYGARVRKITPAGVISTVAGTGVTGYSGDNGPGTSAQLNAPGGLAMDASGNLYIADSNNGRIRKLSATGTITTVAGNGCCYGGDGGPATSALFNYPRGVALDASGNMYIADTNNQRVRKVSAAGTVTTVAGTGTAGYSGDNGPATSALLNRPNGVSVDASGNVYIADSSNNRIRLVSATGTITTVVGTGVCCFSGDNGPATSAQINSPQDLTFDAAGNMYIADWNNQRIRVVNTAGIIATIAGTGAYGYSGEGGPALNASFKSPYGVTVDSAGNVYVAEGENNVLRLLTVGGSAPVLTVSSSHTGSFAPGASGQYTVTVTNAALAAATSGTVTVAETLPPSVTLVSMSGTGWSCASNTCTRSDALAGGSSYPAITVTVNVTALAPAQVSNQVTVSGGGAPLNAAVDLTLISGTVPDAPVLVSPANGAFGVSTSAGLTWNSANGATSYDVYFGPATPPPFAANTAATNYSPAGLIAGTLYYWQVVSKSSSHTASSAVWSFNTGASGSCSYVLSQSANSLFSAGGVGSLTVTAPAGCGWTAVSNQTWLVVTAGASGVGNGTVSYSAGGNTGGLRSATLTIGGQTFTLSQVGTYLISTMAGGLLPATSASGTAVSIGGSGGPATDSAGNLYFPAANAVFRLDLNGVLTRIAGTGIGGYSGDSGPALTAQLNGPAGVAVDAGGNLYIADAGNNRIRKISTIGTITTVAGTGTCCYSGDGGSATGAQLNGPQGIFVDGSGNLYIADANNNRVRMVSSNGTITTVAGTGVAGYSGDNAAATSAQLSYPHSVAVDASGNLFVADQNNHRIRKVATSGTITTAAGTGTAGYSGDNGAGTSAQINTPNAVSIDSAGNVYIADTNNCRIRKLATNGTITTVAGNGGPGFSGDGGAATSAALRYPVGVVLDTSGNLFFVDNTNQRIRKVSSGTITTVAGGGTGDGGPASLAGFATPWGIARDGSGNIYVSDVNYNRVREISSAGTISLVAGTGVTGGSGDNGPATSAQFYSPSGLAVDPAGNVYIADTWTARVRRVSTAGTVTTVVGSTGGYSGDNGPAVSAQINVPQGLAMDVSGNLYIADSGNHAIRRVSTSGTITTVAGTGTAGYSGDSGPATTAKLNNPLGVAVDAAGNLYIADATNNRIRRVSTTGTITTVAGTGTAGSSGDNGPATSAQLSSPCGVAVDAAGNLYIADTGNNRIREVTATGVIGTIANFSGPCGLTVDDSGNVTYAGQYDRIVHRLTPGGIQPVLTLTSSHTGSFGPGTSGQYTLTVSNAALAGATSGTVTVTDILPSSLTLASMAGTGWTCSANTCTRSDVLSGGSSYPAITVTVNVSASAPTQVTNQTTVAGGGALMTGTGDLTVVTAPVLKIAKTHGASFTFGQSGASYTVTVSNQTGAGPTTGAVVVTEAVPSGLTLVSMAGTGWTCAAGGNTCTRSDGLAGGASYPAITVTVNVGAAASSPQINTVSVSGGGSVTANASDTTYLSAALPVTSGLVLQLDAGTGLAANGSSWTDLSGSGHNATALTGQAPTVVANGLNGRPVAAFSGNQAMALAGQVLTSQQFTILALVTDSSGASGVQLRDIFSNWDSTNSTTSVFLGDAGPNSTNHPTTTAARFTDGLAASNNGVGIVVNPTQPFVLSAQSTTTDAVIWQDNAQIAARGSALPTRNLTTAYYIGKQGTYAGGEYWQGYLAELLVYNRALSTAELSSAVSYLGTKWLGTVPSLTVASSHAGNFTQGQTGATYSITVSNSASSTPTSGSVTVTENVPAGFTLVSMAGTGWTCPSGGNTCSRSDALPAGSSYPPIAVTTNVSAIAPAFVINQVTALGGGALAPATASDNTSVQIALQGAVAAGRMSSFKINADGTVWAWGDNSMGELGDGTLTMHSRPVQVYGLSGVVAMSAGYGHALALKSDGTVWGWGQNWAGHLGDGTTTQRLTPVPVGGLTGITAISAGQENGLALKSDGTVWAWGYNSNGQLGDNTTTNRTSPVQVSGLTGIVAIAGGSYFSLAVKNDGTVWSWGQNNVGQLGDGTTTQRLTPVQVTGLTGVIAVSGGAGHALALKSDGTVWGWGQNGSGQLGDGTGTQRLTPVQSAGLSGIVALTSRNHNLALKSDGAVWIWGLDTDGQIGNNNFNNVTPAVQVSGVSTAISVAAGDTHSLILKSDGSMLTMGFNGNAELGTGATVLRATPAIASGISGVAGASVSYNHAVAVKTDGTVWTWGRNLSGQLGNGTVGFGSGVPAQVGGLNGFVAVAAGTEWNVALRSDGTVWTWGANGSGQLGDGSTSQRNSPVQVTGLTNVVAIAAGQNHSMALKSDGSVWTWGWNTYGQIGDGTTNNRLTPFQVLTGAVAIATGAGHTLALKSDGTLWAWGLNSNGQLGDNTTTNRTTPVQVSGLTGVSRVSGGWQFSLALKADGTVWGWGTNGNGQLGDGTTSQRITPVQATGLAGAVTLAAGATHSLAVKGDGSVWAWGMNVYGQLGDGTTTQRNTPVQTSAVSGVTAVAGGGNESFAIETGGSLWTWGSFSYGQLANAATDTVATPTAVVAPAAVDLNITQVASPSFQVGGRAGYSVNVGNLGGLATSGVTTVTDVLPAGLTYAAGMGTGWSCSAAGQTVTCTTSNAIYPGAGSSFTLLLSVGAAAAPSVSNTVTVAYSGDGNPANNSSTVVSAVGAAPASPSTIVTRNYWNLKLNPDGTLWAWGANSYGQMGDGSTIQRSAPAIVPGLTGVIAIGAGNYHAMAVRNDGSLWTWGVNGNGQLGDGTFVARTRPIQVNGLSGITAVSGGSAHSLALKGDGTVWSWGSNQYGQLGDASVGNRSTPAPISGLSGVVAVAAGDYSSLALRSDGTVWTWGWNNSGQLGDGTTTSHNTPSPVAGLSGVVNIFSAGSSVLAVRVDGTVWAWGNNSSGQLGDGTNTQRNSPALVSGLSGILGVAIGPTHSLALKSGGTVWVWGSTQNFGNYLPVQVAEVTNAVAVAAGSNHSLALRSDGTMLAWGYGLYGELGDGTPSIQALPAEALISNVVSMAAGSTHAAVARTDGTVWAWGDNEWGQLGDGTTQLHALPAPVTGITGVTAVAAGNAHVLALKNDGTVWAWGYGGFGRLGNGATSNVSLPVQAIGLTSVKAIAAGYHFSLALKQDGTVWAWGYNTLGQLGDGTTTDRYTPVQVSGLTGVVSIAAGLYHGLAVKNDGTVWAWGYNYYGQLGDGSNANRTAPVQVSGLSGVVAVGSSFGSYHSLALKSDGTVWGWGYNYDGELGTASPTTRNTPAQVPGIAGAVTLAAGSYHSLALLSDRTVWAWGTNSFGQLGDGSIATRYAPAQVAGLSNVASITGGTSHSYAIAPDGTLWGWGATEFGQLGGGITELKPTPVAVSAPLSTNLAITKSHTGNFTQGQTGVTYQLVVSNAAATAPTSGLVAASEILPAGSTLASMSGNGWICTTNVTAPACMRSDPLAAGASYPPVTVTVNVAANAPALLTNQASAAGGGSATALATDPTTIIAIPVLSVTKSHTGTFAQSQNGATYSVTVSNTATAASTSGTVTLTETIPTGLTLVSMDGTGWTCAAGGNTCTRSDVLASSSSYPAITVTVNVDPNPLATLTNQVTVTGGGSAAATASDLTYITFPCSYSISPASGTIGAAGGSGSFSVSTGPLCSWTPSASDSSWISVPNGVVTGGGTVAYHVTTPNAGTTPRTGTITAGGQTYTITQFGSTCSLWLSPASIVATSAGGLATVGVSTSNPSCAWTASGLNASPASGTGNGVVTFTVPSNPNAAAQVLTANVQSTSGGPPMAFVVSQTGTACTTQLSAPSASIISSGGIGSVNVTTPAGCSYSTVNGPNWISLTAGAVGSGPGPVALTYTVAPNSATVSRTATLAIGSQTYTVTQDATPCSVTVDASSSGSPFANAGGSGALAVTANGSNCSWTASSPVPWATLSPLSGTGSGTINVTTTSNASSTVSRTATLNVAGQSVALTQGGTICSYTLGSSTASVPFGGGTGSVTVTAPAACTWSSTTDPYAPWLTIPSSGSGGTSTVVFTATANATATARSGTLLIAGQPYTVTEAAAPCNYLLNASNTTVGAAGDSGLFTFSTGTAGCSATAQSFAGWLTTSTTSSADGTSGTVNFTAAPNPGAVRAGAIQFGGQSYVVVQTAAACIFTLDTGGTIISKTGGPGSVLGSPSPPSCTPAIATDSPDIVTLGALSGPVSNLLTLPFTVGTYNSVVTGIRQMTITFGGQLFTIKQTSW